MNSGWRKIKTDTGRHFTQYSNTVMGNLQPVGLSQWHIIIFNYFSSHPSFMQAASQKRLPMSALTTASYFHFFVINFNVFATIINTSHTEENLVIHLCFYKVLVSLYFSSLIYHHSKYKILQLYYKYHYCTSVNRTYIFFFILQKMHQIKGKRNNLSSAVRKYRISYHEMKTGRVNKQRRLYTA